ncbi:MAG: ABC transporter substrate-binding protein [Actinomycetota bacterium]|nr:ABC transporter substrate-binding protein [Actinomycetota bacterium]
MTDEGNAVSPDGGVRPWPAIGWVRRMGPAVLVVLLLVAAGTVATVHSRVGSGPGVASQGGGAEGSAAGIAVTYQQAKAAGTTANYDWGPGCDTSTGRLKMPMVGAPPCVALSNKPNGGATWSGVTGSTITVVYYVPAPGGLTTSLAGATDSTQAQLATVQAFTAMLNRIVPLDGRKVVVVPFQATGGSDDPVAGRADAISVAQDLHAFASLGGPQQTSAYEDELARLHVLCLACGLSVPYSGYQQDAPYLWGALPSPDTLLTDALQLVVSQLVGKDAIYAGESAMRHRKRTFAMVHYDQNPPIYGALNQKLTREFAATKLRLVDNESYLLDLPELPQEAATIAAHLKASNATTVIFAGDPIMPIYLTKAAAAIGYYPEWVITGTVLTDTTTLGRLYDQQEWAHAFGISTLPVPLPPAQAQARTLYEWYYGKAPAAAKTVSLILEPIELLFVGAELAGPDLTPTTFQQGLFHMPPTGGGPTDPRIGFGPNGPPPLPAYSSPADFTLIWWDPTATGVNEEGAYGTGMYRYVDGGRRYPAGKPVGGTVHFFARAGSVTGYAEPPPGSRPPSYPPWPGSPTAGG